MRKIIHITCSSLLVLMILFLVPAKIIAQADSTAQTDSSAQTVVKEASTYAPLITFVSIQKNDNSVDLKTSVKAKINGTLTSLSGLMIEFTIGTDSLAKKLGEVSTDNKGTATLNCKPDQLITDKEGKLNFKASFAGKDSLESAEEVLAVKRARIEITPVKEDSILTVKVRLVDLSTGAETPVPETDIGVFVNRMFSALKVGEGKTDEAGEASVEIPNNLPGDDKGSLTLVARVDENEIYGNLEASVAQQWGTPVSSEIRELPRSLWSPHPPIWMLVTFIILMAAVWGHYLVIIIQLIRLRKEEPEPN